MGARGARSDDACQLLFRGLHYITTLVGELNPPIDGSRDKELQRGFNNLTLARLLCPVEYINEFDANPQAYASP
jgi:hypothetical protein